jgi:peptidylprolyl isomerase
MDRLLATFNPSKEIPMQKVENGMYVSVDYIGTLENGEQFDSSEGRAPLEFKVGQGRVIKGFEEAVVGMALNEKKTFTLSPAEAYGPRDDSCTYEFPRSEIPPEITPEVGQTLALRSPDGREVPARIVAVDDQKVTFDLNHPLAGESLTFEIQIKNISDTATQPAAGCDSGCDCSSGCDC